MDIVTYALCKKYTNERVSELEALGPFTYKGSVPTYDDLPTTGRKKGHVWTVEDTGDEYVWNGDTWIKFGANKELPDATLPGTAVIYDGSNWTAQEGYGYVEPGSGVVHTTDNKYLPVGSSSAFGVFKSSGSYGIKSTDGVLQIEAASDSGIAAKSSGFFPIVPSKLDKAIMEGLGNNSLSWSAGYKESARATIGAASANDVLEQTMFLCDMADGSQKTLTLNGTIS